ncbi:hypothetical protein CCR75_008748 [Bremia lactucae]|uniref:COMM domain-containing protein n=1 Tax=Bremia lactucae TaxID=4779 RepID=A0A976NYM2_BRELC|nr:hypothetical protein CCR75_008748 [Bremia lactucae]
MHCADNQTRTESYKVLNFVAKDKLEASSFTMEENIQMGEVFAMSNTQIGAIFEVAKEVFLDAATFDYVDRTVLSSRGVDDHVAFALEKMWKYRDLSLRKQIALAHKVKFPVLMLRKSDWRLHLEMGSSNCKGLSQTKAIFQLDLVDTRTDEAEKLDIELSHAELRSLFTQLNAIQQEELDVALISSRADN